MRDQGQGSESSATGSDLSTGRKTLGEWLGAGPFRLVMSSGFFGFFAHTGMLRALDEAGLRPAAVAGSSAGALVGGLWASGREAGEIREALLGLRRADFWDPGVGLGPLRPGRGEGLGPGLLRGGKFRRKLDSLLGAATFGACRVPAALSTYDIFGRRTRVLDEARPERALAPAIHASCAVPGMFQPVWVEGRALWDGGVSDRPGMEGVGAGERVLHHHLASRSPWRRMAPQPPRREGLVALVIDGLPRASPFRLAEGRGAMEMAYECTRRSLAAPVSPRIDLQA